jgi:hypothetical protein
MQGNETMLWQSNLLKAVTRTWSMPLISDYSEQRERSRLPPWSYTAVANNLRHTFLDSLGYQELSHRQDRISGAFAKTFEWIFQEQKSKDKDKDDKPWSSFRKWLTRGSDVYWITGKAGSGKSTLMKFVYNDPRTEQLLLGYRPGYVLVTAAFYFWNSGTDIQMSQDGLLRSLLYQSIRKRPTSSLPCRLDGFSLSKDYSKPWTWTELVQAFRFLIEDGEDSSINYVFFVDGLDEFEGDKSSLISLIYQISSSPNVKVCVSSRPWPVFEDAFKQKPSLMLQYLTYGDIEHYVHENLNKHRGFRELTRGIPFYAGQLMENITNKASGVFLWVVLVVRSLIEGLTDGDRISDLQRRLDELPEELEDLFKKMLKSLKPAYFKHASQLFQIFQTSKTRPTLLVLSFADEEDDEYALRREVSPLTDDETFYRAMSMKRRLDSRCRGLLEVAPLKAYDNPQSFSSRLRRRELDLLDANEEVSDMLPALKDPNEASDAELRVEDGHLLAYARVEFLHRTVKDFFERPDNWCFITNASDSGLNPNASLCRSYILQLKTLRLETILTSETFLLDVVAWCLEYAEMVGRTDVDVHVRLLNAVDQVASVLGSAVDDEGRFYVQRYSGRLDSHWATIISGGEQTDTFLAFAARCHLFNYVKAILEQSPPNKMECTKVLCTLLSNYQLPFIFPDRSICSPTEPDLRIIRLLLDFGADPNCSVDGRSPWRRFLEKSTPVQRESDGIWKEIEQTLNEYGVNEEQDIVEQEGEQKKLKCWSGHMLQPPIFERIPFTLSSDGRDLLLPSTTSDVYIRRRELSIPYSHSGSTTPPRRGHIQQRLRREDRWVGPTSEINTMAGKL